MRGSPRRRDSPLEPWLPVGAPYVAVSRRYELFDQSVFLIIMGLVGYVLNDAPTVSQLALAAPLEFADETTWGLALTAVGVIGVTCSYMAGPLLQLGYRVVTIGAAFWGVCFIIGLVAFDAPPRGLVSAVIYLAIVSRLRRTGDWSESRISDFVESRYRAWRQRRGARLHRWRP